MMVRLQEELAAASACTSGPSPFRRRRRSSGKVDGPSGPRARSSSRTAPGPGSRKRRKSPRGRSTTRKRRTPASGTGAGSRSLSRTFAPVGPPAFASDQIATRAIRPADVLGTPVAPAASTETLPGVSAIPAIREEPPLAAAPAPAPAAAERAPRPCAGRPVLRPGPLLGGAADLRRARGDAGIRPRLRGCGGTPRLGCFPPRRGAPGDRTGPPAPARPDPRFERVAFRGTSRLTTSPRPKRGGP